MKISLLAISHWSLVVSHQLTLLRHPDSGSCKETEEGSSKVLVISG